MLRALILFTLFTPGLAAACPGPAMFFRAQDDIPRNTPVDQALINQTILYFVNEERCAAGLRILVANQSAISAAAEHATNMAQRNFFSHTSPVPGRADLGARLTAATIRFRAAGENLAQHFGVQYDTSKTYITYDEAACDYAYIANGPAIPRQTYISAGEILVQQWMDSPGHRANILNPDYTHHGAGIAFNNEPALCGQMLAAQVLYRE